MHRLAQPAVLKSAALAASLTSLACYPRVALWHNPLPTWYLMAMLFVSSFVLWGFVFAWHTAFTQHPVFTTRFDARLWVLATVTGLLVAATLHFVLDPTFRERTPGDYPNSLAEWLGMTAFTLAFNPLMLTFAPLAWAVRLSRRLWIAVVFTILFHVAAMVIKTQSAPTPVPPSVFAQLLALRFVLGSGAVFFYLRGGAGLVWWWLALLQFRHLLIL